MSSKCGFCGVLRGPHASNCIAAYPYSLEGLQYTEWADSTKIRPTYMGAYEVFTLFDWEGRPTTPPSEGSGVFSTYTGWNGWWGVQSVVPKFDIVRSVEQRLWWRGLSGPCHSSLTATLRGGNWRITYDPLTYGRILPWEAYYAGKTPPSGVGEDLVPFRYLEEAIEWLQRKGVSKSVLTKALRGRLHAARTINLHL